MKLGGSLEDKEAAPFLAQLYAEWKKLEIPLASTEAWFSKRLAGYLSLLMFHRFD